MSLQEANAVQMRAQQALSALTPTKFPLGSGGVSVNLGVAALKSFDKPADADAYVSKLDAALKPFRDEIEAQAVSDIKAALS